MSTFFTCSVFKGVACGSRLSFACYAVEQETELWMTSCDEKGGSALQGWKPR